MPPSKGPPPPLRTADELRVMSMVKWLLYLLFIIISWWTVAYLASVLSLVLVALGVAYLLSPPLDWMVSKGIPRALGALLLVLAFVGTVVALIIIFAPKVAEQIAGFVSDLPAMIDKVQVWATNHGIDLPADWRDKLEGAAKEASGQIESLALAAAGGVFSVLGFVTEALLIPIFSFYFLMDWHHIQDRVKKIVPPRNRARVVAVMGEVDGVVSGWVRGQATVTAILAVLYAVGFTVIGLKLAIPIGISVGVLTIIPFIGTFIGAAITLLIVLLDWQGVGPLIGVSVLFVMLHLLEAAVLTPKITGHKVGLSESAALFAVVAGGKLLGFVGVLLAVPLAATVAVLLRHAVRAYEHSTFFGHEDDAHVDIPDAMKTILPDPAALTIKPADQPGHGDHE